MAQGGETGEICDLAQSIATEVQTQQCTKVAQAAALGHAITLPDTSHFRLYASMCKLHLPKREMSYLIATMVVARMMPGT